jgi:GWxTD domain-containing protein
MMHGHTSPPRSLIQACAARLDVASLMAAGAMVVVFLLMLVILLGTVQPARAAMVRPWEGSGNFHSMVDVVNRWRADGTLDVVLLISVANNELTFQVEGGSLSGELAVHALLEGRDGAVIEGERSFPVHTQNEEEATSNTLYQVFPVVLQGVTARSGRLTCRLEDRLRIRPGLLNVIKQTSARSEVVGDWEAPPRDLDAEGLTLADPYFLTKAPIGLWQDKDPLGQDLGESALLDHLHPNRRYGLEQDHLQVYFEVAPPSAGGGRQAAEPGLFLQVLAKDLDFAMRDTIRFDERELRRLQAGGRAGVFYELDVNLLPAGAYQLSCAPASGRGSGWLAEFDVIWRLSGLARHRDELEGEGRTVLFGDRLDTFLAAGQAEREVMLEEFWAENDPDPETEVNEAYLEFRHRVDYVRQKLGGFGRLGARDARGQIFLLLGAPNEIQVESMPSNPAELEDAYVKVFDKFAPDRPGTEAKGGGLGSRVPQLDKGALPIEPSQQAAREIDSKRQTVEREKAFELWRYNHAGRQLFANIYSSQTLGLHFLFVDRTGTGTYVLESTNTRRLGN